jgi:DNA invertase Pin-like site-specific DNA recombinase
MPGFPRPTRISTVRSNASSRRGAGGVYAERASGKSTNGRHELGKALKALQPGDTLVTVKLVIRDLLKLLDDVKEAGARFKALDDPWCDTTTPQGELILTTVVDDDILPLD